MATYSISNFASIEGQFILIYDKNGVLRHSIIPLESNFYTRAHNCVVDTSSKQTDRYIILDFDSVSEATEATTRLESLKTTIQYNIDWSAIRNNPTTLEGYGITDSYNKTEINNIVTGVTIDLSGYYNSAQTNANFLSANTSYVQPSTLNNYYTSSQTNINFVSATTFNEHTNNSNIHFTKSSININDLGDVDTTGVIDGYFLSYSAGTWIPAYGTSSSGSTDLTNYYNKTQTNANFVSASTLYEFIVPVDYDWSNSSTVLSSTTFLIEYSFNLSGQTITLPYNSVLKFANNGSLQNTTIIGNNSFVSSDEHGIGILYNTILTGGTFINMSWFPEWFGYNNSTNWNVALQTAINCAQPKAGEVKLSSKVYQFQEKIVIPAGVSVNGVSRGETAFSAGPTRGSLLFCTSSSTHRAVEVRDKFVTLSNFSIKCESRSASVIDGLVINAIGVSNGLTGITGANIESLDFRNLLIHSCRKGFYLVAGNEGAITYSAFNNIRVRDCIYPFKIEVISKNPIYSNVDDYGNTFNSENAFINSNKWSGLFISGYAPLCSMWIRTEKKNSTNK